MIPWRGLVIMAVGAIVIAAATLVWFALDERSQLMFQHPYGTIRSGAKFGVAIGEQWVQADATLRRRFTTLNDLEWDTGPCVGDAPRGETLSFQPLLHGRANASYRDHSWQNGVITFCVQDGRVISITWDYVGPFYVDF